MIGVFGSEDHYQILFSQLSGGRADKDWQALTSAPWMSQGHLRAHDGIMVRTNLLLLQLKPCQVYTLISADNLLYFSL